MDSLHVFVSVGNIVAIHINVAGYGILSQDVEVTVVGEEYILLGLVYYIGVLLGNSLWYFQHVSLVVAAGFVFFQTEGGDNDQFVGFLIGKGIQLVVVTNAEP